MYVPSSVVKLNPQAYFSKAGQEESFAGFQVKRSQHLMALGCSINLPQAARENCIFFSYFVFVSDISVSHSNRVSVVWRCGIQGWKQAWVTRRTSRSKAGISRCFDVHNNSWTWKGSYSCATHHNPLVRSCKGVRRQEAWLQQPVVPAQPNPKPSSAGEGDGGCSRWLWPLPVLSVACPTFIQESGLTQLCNICHLVPAGLVR